MSTVRERNADERVFTYLFVKTSVHVARSIQDQLDLVGSLDRTNSRLPLNDREVMMIRLFEEFFDCGRKSRSWAPNVGYEHLLVHRFSTRLCHLREGSSHAMPSTNIDPLCAPCSGKLRLSSVRIAQLPGYLVKVQTQARACNSAADTAAHWAFSNELGVRVRSCRKHAWPLCQSSKKLPCIISSKPATQTPVRSPAVVLVQLRC